MAAADFFATVQKIYIAYYGRAADAGGLNYWANQLNSNGGNLTAIINSFGNSAEYTLISNGLNATQLVDQIYVNLFNRHADSAGLNWYVNEMISGRKTLATIALDILNGARNEDLLIVNAKVDVATQFTAAMDTTLEQNSYTTATMGFVKTWLSGVSGGTADAINASKTTVAGNIQYTIQQMIGDFSAPNAPVISAISSDTGASASDNITNDSTLTLTMTAEAGSTVKVYSGATLLGTATETTAGNFSFTTAALSSNSYSLYATSTDGAGNVSAASAAKTVVVDLQAPVEPVITSFGSNSGSALDNITNDNTVTLNIVAEAGSTVRVYNGVNLLGTATESSAGRFTFTTSALADATYNFTAKATDVAGNESAASVAQTVVVDATAPSAPVLALGTGVAGGATALEALTGVVTVNAENGSSVALTFTGTVGNVVKTVTGTGSAQAVALSVADLASLGNGAVSVSAVDRKSVV